MYFEYCGKSCLFYSESCILSIVAKVACFIASPVLGDDGQWLEPNHQTFVKHIVCLLACHLSGVSYSRPKGYILANGKITHCVGTKDHK